MILSLESGTTIPDPSDEEIANSLPLEEFGIIRETIDSSSYLQFAEEKEPPWELILEYQIDSLDNHFKAVDAPLTMERITRAFQKYARGDDSWKTDFKWEHMEF